MYIRYFTSLSHIILTDYYENDYCDDVMMCKKTSFSSDLISEGKSSALAIYFASSRIFLIDESGQTNSIPSIRNPGCWSIKSLLAVLSLLSKSSASTVLTAFLRFFLVTLHVPNMLSLLLIGWALQMSQHSPVLVAPWIDPPMLPIKISLLHTPPLFTKFSMLLLVKSCLGL